MTTLTLIEAGGRTTLTLLVQHASRENRDRHLAYGDSLQQAMDRLEQAARRPGNATERRTMARLLYMAITSLDGYVADEAGGYDWAMPDDEVFGFVNDFERPVGTYLYGRRLYQEMTGWETMDANPGLSPLMLDFARIWQAADKVVYSRSLEAVSTARTRLERDFDPGSVRQMKARADRDITVGGPVLAAEAIRAGLTDEIHLVICPVVVGGGKKALPGDVRLRLELLDQRRFGNGVVHLRYRVVS